MGSHGNLFYNNLDELMELLPSFFNSGVENNHYCIWVISDYDFVTVEKAKKALKNTGFDVDFYIESDKFEITHENQLGFSDITGVLNFWKQKYLNAIDNGFNGLWMIENLTLIFENYPSYYLNYESLLDEIIKNRNMVSLCSYDLTKCSQNNTLDLISCHDRTLLKKDGVWKFLEEKTNNNTISRLNNTFYEKILDSIWLGVWVVDSSDNVVFFNKTMESIFGVPREEILGTSLMDYIAEQRLVGDSHLEELYLHTKISCEPVTYNALAFLTPTGNINYHNGVLVPIFDETGNYEGILGTVEEATSTKRKISDISICDTLEAKHKIEKIYETSPVIAFLWKAINGWPVEYVSENITQFGYKPEEFLSGQLTYVDIVHPDDVDKLKSDFSVYEKQNKNSYFTSDYRILTKTGETRWVTEKSLIIHNQKGAVKYLQGIIIDITERKKAEETLQLEESRLETLLKLNYMTGASLQEITDFAREEAVRLTNSKLGYLAFLNYDESILIMHSWSEGAMKECKVENKPFVYPVKTTGLWGEAVRQRKPIITNNYTEPSSLKKGYPEGHVGLKRHMNVPIFDGEHIVLVAGVGNKEQEYDESDIRQLTLLMQGMWKLIQRKQFEEALKKYSNEIANINSELKSLEKMKNEILNGKPTSTGYKELLDRETLETINEQRDIAINTLVRSSEQINSLIGSLLYMSMEESGKLDYTFSLLNIKEPINSAYLNLALSIDEKDINLNIDIPENFPEIYGDKNKLTDMFTYLIDNSVKYTPKGGNIDISAFEAENDLYIKVADNGEGIPKDLVPTLFQGFSHSEETLTHGLEKAGSSLYVCKKIVNAHGGQISVDSKEGIGTTVTIVIPLKGKDLVQ
ncbi:MEDS domain-containing protein [Methanohalobium sp.]|uniref:MEDS domain-containing protein n=1 Tax=Methanohalobium sp. TaxID=2837493 RepID=UPI0025E663C4|nr:MEDS domain-containing protein [Methanohalobium sp.]